MKLALQRITTPVEEELARLPRSNPSFQEYFVAEVLDLQPEPVQRFLLRTSVLNRLTGSLCDMVAEQQNSRDMLAALERANLFLEPLDGQWYRYHSLFSEAMRNEAYRRMGEDQLRSLSARASCWYEEHGFFSEAVDAALSAQDHERAALLIERSTDMQVGNVHEAHTLHRWLEQLPETTLRQHPMLCLNYATTLLFTNTSWRPSQLTQHVLEKLLPMAEQSFRVENNLPKLGELFAFRSLLAWRQDETRTSAIYAQQALAWLPKAQSLMQGAQRIWRGFSLCMAGRECIAAGQFQQARAASLEAQALCDTNRYIKRVATIQLAQVCFEQGEIQQAASAYRQALASAREDGHTMGICFILTGLANLSYEWNELESAYQLAQEVIALSQSLDLEFHTVRATLIQARILQAQGQASTAQQRLAALLDRIPASLSSLSQEIQAAQARLALAVGDHMTLQRWATGRKPLDNFSLQVEDTLLLARWLRIQGKPEEALQQLERSLATAQEVEHTRLILEIQVEMILVEAVCKRKAEAQKLLQAVLAQAFDRGYIRLFLDAGEPMAFLLRSLLPQVREQPLLAYMRALLKAFPVQPQIEFQALTSSFIEPLSPQEIRVLRLIVQHHSNAEIARELVVSINTVRTQVQSIYRKLGVHKRSAASEVAHDLHLL